MVGTFHGHVHNHLCQLGWHPMYIEGAGNMEGEGSIEEHIAFWNKDKYEALSTCCSYSFSSFLISLLAHFIQNHYQEAMDELTFLKAALNLTDDDFPQFIAEEHLYLNSLKQPLKRMEWSSACDGANAALSGIVEGDFSTMANAINQACIWVKLAYTKLQNTEALAAHIQGQLGLESPWKVDGEEYNHYREEAMFGKYHEALGELEQLVIMCLFELSKLAMLGTGK
ncbi:hypothetical protein EDC04DRAFT_2875760 [Pisolithus marmoratus]|nr:hypothetical protein EDC04DRAFT_2875760 [Pisolithus marmoratus]